MFVFLSTECPVSNGYTNTLNQIDRQFANRKLDFFVSFSDTSISRAHATKHFADFKTNFPILFDASGCC